MQSPSTFAQGEHHKTSMDQMYSADRQSLLAEIRDLRSHASITRLQLQEEKQRLSQQLSSTEEQLSKREHHLKRQRKFPVISRLAVISSVQLAMEL